MENIVLENWINMLNKHGEGYNHPRTEDLSKQFYNISELISTLIGMHKSKNHSADEFQELRNFIQADLGILYHDLTLYQEETPDEMTKTALSDLHDHQYIFTK